MTDLLSHDTGKLDLVSKIIEFRAADLKASNSYAAGVVLLVAAVFFSQDIYVDVVVEGKGLGHIVVEAGIFVAVLLALALEVRRAIRLRAYVSFSQKENQKLRKHLSEVISTEFDRWQLSKAEREIALLLIKGLSMQEIADARNVKEKSIRQQTSGIYSKAGVASRYELASHFIEDLLAPGNMSQ